MTAGTGAAGLVHRAMFYRDEAEYASGIVPFVTAGLVAGDAVMIAVPAPTLDRLRGALGARARRVHFADMSELGRNPGRIIPAVVEFVRQFAGRRTRFVGEPIWRDRTTEEIAEATRHEALINLAFADLPVEVLCPYDTASLDAATIEDSLRTHPEEDESGVVIVSDHYCDPVKLLAEVRWALPAPPGSAAVLEFGDVSAVRSHVRRQAAAADMRVDRLDDLVLAVSEVANNTVQHGGGSGALRVWIEGGEVVCEISDAGRIEDPLVGRHAPGPDAEPAGLWLVNQLSDLVQIRSGPDGTRVRLRFEI